MTPQELEQAGEAQDKDQSENQGENKNQDQKQRLRENYEPENDHRKNQQKNQESEGNQGLEEQQQPKNAEQQNTGQQKQNEVEQNQAQQQKNSKSKESKIYGVNLVDKQGSMPWRIPLSLTHDEDKEFTPWHAPLILAHDEDKEFEEEPKQDYYQKQILNREHELQKKKEKLEREAKTSELQEKYEELKILECRIREQEDAVRKKELREQQRQAEKIEQQRQSEAQQKAQDEAELQKISERLNQAIDSFYKPENFFAKTTPQQSNSNKDSTVSERLNQALDSFYDPKTFLSSLSEAQQKAREQERLKLRDQEEKARIALEKKRLKYEKKQYEIRRGEQEFENLKACLENAKQLLLNARTLDQVNHAIQSFERIRDYASDDFLYAFDSTVEKQRRKIEKAQEKSQNRSSSDSSSNYDNREYDYGYQSSNSEYPPYQYSEREVEYRIASILTVPNWQRTPRERSFLNQYPDYAREVYQNTCYKLMDILNTNYYDRREAEDRFLEQYSWMIPKLKEQLNQEFIQYQRENLVYHNWLYGNRIKEILRKTPFEPSCFNRMTLSRNPMLTNLIAEEIEKERQQEQEAKDAKEAKEEFERQRRSHQQRSTQQNSQLQGNPSTQPQPTPASQQPRSAPAPVPAPIPAPRPIYVPEARKKLSARITGNYGDNAIRNRNRERLASIEQTVYSNSKMSYGYELSTNKNNPAPYRNRFHHVREGLYSHYPDTSYFTGNVAQIKSHQHQVEILNQTYRLYHQQVNKPFEANKNITVQNIGNTAFRYLERATYANQYQNHERTYALEDFCHALNQTQLSLVSFLDGKESRVGNFFSSLFTQADYSTAFGNRLWDAITSNSTDENLNDLAWHNNQASTHLARALQNSYPTSQEFKNIILNRVPALLQAYNTNQPNAAQNIVRFATRMVFYGNGSAENYNHQNVQNQTIINDIVNAVESENRIAGNRNKNARHYGALRPLATIFSNALQKCLDSAQAAPVQQPAPVVILEPIPQPSIDQPQVEPTITTPPVEPQVQPITAPQVQPTITAPPVEPIEEPITIPETQPTRKKAAPRRKSGARISKARKKTAPKVTSKRKATDELENPRLPKQRRLPKEKGSAPTRKQPSRAVKQKTDPTITCPGSGPFEEGEELSVDVDVEMLNDDEEDQRAAQEERDAQLAQQLQQDEDMNLEDQSVRYTPAVLQNLYNHFQEKYIAAQQVQDDLLGERCQQRIDAVTQTMERGGSFDYSDMIDGHPIFTDPEAHVFDQCNGTFIDKQLHQELCLTRTTMHQLLEINPGSARVQAFAPMIDHLTALIKQEQDLVNAFGLADYAHDLLQIIAGGINILNAGIDYAEIGVDTTLRGMIRGVQTSLDPQHWKEMGLGLLELGVFFANEVAHIEAFDNAMISSVINNNPDILMETSKEFEKHYLGHAQVAAQLLQDLKNMSWEQLIENGAQFGTTFVLDGVICHAATLAATKGGRALVSDLAAALNSGTSSEHVAEIIGVGKIALEEGPEVANAVVETVKKNPTVLAQDGKSSVQVLKEVTEDVVGIAKNREHQITQVMENDLAQMYKTTTLGKGSTGRTIPKTLNEQLAMKEVLSDPLSNAKELNSVRMTDPRWLEEDGWAKMSKNVNGIEIHYVHNHKTGAFDDFKFK